MRFVNTTWAVSLMGALLLGGTASAKKNANSGVLPPQSNPHGQSYGNWGGAWWTWVLNIPVESNPAFDVTGEFCGEDQSGSVFFLSGTFVGDAVRDCTVPTGKALFFPIVNIAMWSPEDIIANGGNPDDLTQDEQAALVHDYATFWGDQMDILEVSVDGVALANLQDYRGTSDPYFFEMEEGNVFGYAPGTKGPAVSDGFWIMLAPLSSGEHTIEFTGGISSYPFQTTVTYNLTIAPGN